ncbi:uncharacterized protein LOC135350301 [Halichondria panicea]|uniref:uncharacterized protein LOC135350301 n=1 Tax=Halichondria panicea TaxID=6063 RepID=UPI00312B99D9
MEETVLCYFEDPENLTVVCNGVQYKEEDIIEPSDFLFWLYLILYGALVCFAGLMSGLTMGLLSLDIMSLEVLKRGGKPKEKKYASRILMLVKRHHLLLVTLLLANAAAVETMPIFLNKITLEVVAIIVSVTAVLLVGEIVPQAICTRFGLAIGYYCSPIVLVLMAILFPISFPIAKLLDLILGKEHSTFFRRAELRELVKMHGDGEQGNEDPLSYDEVLIVKSALEMRDKTVEDAMTPLESVYMLNINAIIDRDTMKDILARGHSRVPVYNNNHDNVCGILLVKTLIHLDPEDCTPVKLIRGSQIPPPSCLTITPLYDILNQFQTGRSHLALVYKEEGENTEPILVGIITLEDVIEELIGEEIVDETDQYVDVHRRIAVAKARLQYHRQSISAPSAIATNRRRSKFDRSNSQPALVHQHSVGPAGSINSTGSEEPYFTNPKLTAIPEGLEASRQQYTEDAAQLDNEDENAPLIVEIK